MREGLRRIAIVLWFAAALIFTLGVIAGVVWIVWPYGKTEDWIGLGLWTLVVPILIAAAAYIVGGFAKGESHGTRVGEVGE